MSKRRLGVAGPELTTCGLGTWTFGGPYEFGWGPQDDAESVAAVRHAVERGVNWLDTAPAYGFGHAEEVVGRAVEPYGAGENVFVFTKCGRVWDERRRLATDLSPASIRRECDESLRRLGIERIDLYQFHWPDTVTGTPLEESWTTMGELVDEGKVRWIGVCNFTRDLLARIEPIRHVDSVQPPLNLIERRACDELLPWTREHGSGVIAYSPLASGLLSGGFAERRATLAADDWRRTGTAPAAWKFREPHLSRALDLVEEIRPIAARLDVPVGVVAIAWVLSLEGVTGAIAGARRPAQVDDWVAALALSLDDGSRAGLEEAIAKIFPEPGPPDDARPGR
jgi:aryl-alcohol dehydrogenase-like predicted oxidoreductase